MIHYVTGDIFQSDAEALVNTINTEGIIGKGIALHFKKRYPGNYRAYERQCQNNKITVGHVFVYTETTDDGKKTIINFPTKKLWKDKSNLEEISLGLADLAENITTLGIKSVAIPPLGCGLGGLNWDDVKSEIEKNLAPIPDVHIYVYTPISTKKPSSATGKRETSELKKAILSVFLKYMQRSHSTDISSIESNNLIYFLQNFGFELKLKFAPYRYGIYCNNLDSFFYDVEGRWIQRTKSNDTFSSFRFSANADIESLKAETPYTEREQKVLQFVDGYENPLGMELLATIHWLVFKENVERNVLSVQNGIQNWCSKNKQNWGERKLYYFTPDLLEKAITRINTCIA